MDTETAEQMTNSDTATIARAIAEGHNFGIILRDDTRIEWSLSAKITAR